MPDPILALHTYDLNRIWFSYRAVDGTWNLSNLYCDTASTGGDGNCGASCSAGIENIGNVGNPRGVIAYGSNENPGGPRPRGRPWFIGEGLPEDFYPIEIDNLSYPEAGIDGATDNLQYWDMAHGAWWINGAFWACLQYVDQVDGVWRLAMIESVEWDVRGNPTLWHHHDGDNAPSLHADYRGCALRWDGVSEGIDFFAQVDADPTQWALYRFDCVTKTWSGPTGSINMGRRIFPGNSPRSQNGANSNGIFRFPTNDDIGVLYTDQYNESSFYRLWNGAAWSAQFTIATHAGSSTLAIGQVIPDLAGEILHVFEIYIDSAWHGRYHIVAHDGTVTANCFAFPDRGNSDGFGRGLIWDNKIFIPWDDFDPDATNTVWVGPLTGGATTLLEEELPKPVIEEGNVPSCTYLIHTQGEIPPIPPSFASIFPEYIKRRNLLAH